MHELAYTILSVLKFPYVFSYSLCFSHSVYFHFLVFGTLLCTGHCKCCCLCLETLFSTTHLPDLSSCSTYTRKTSRGLSLTRFNPLYFCVVLFTDVILLFLWVFDNSSLLDCKLREGRYRIFDIPFCSPSATHCLTGAILNE